MWRVVDFIIRYSDKIIINRDNNKLLTNFLFLTKP